MKIGIECEGTMIYFNDQEVKDNLGENIELKEHILNLAMEYIDNEKQISKYKYNKKHGIKIKKLEYPRKAA